MASVVIAYVICTECDARINLFHMKDAESYSHVEVERHMRARHPGVVKNGTMPYSRVEFETVQSDR